MNFLGVKNAEDKPLENADIKKTYLEKHERVLHLTFSNEDSFRKTLIYALFEF